MGEVVNATTLSTRGTRGGGGEISSHLRCVGVGIKREGLSLKKKKKKKKKNDPENWVGVVRLSTRIT